MTQDKSALPPHSSSGRRGPGDDDAGLPDAELLAAYERGDQKAASTLFRRYYNRLIRLVAAKRGWKLSRLESSDDVVQSVFRSVFVRGRDGQFELKGDEELWPLLATIALRKIYGRAQHWDRQCRDPERIADDSVAGLPQANASPDGAAMVSETIDNLLQAFPERRQAIVSLLIQGHEIAEIARAVGVSERTVYSTRTALADQLRRAAGS